MDKELNRCKALEIEKEKNAGTLNRTSNMGPDWMQTTKNFYGKEHVGVSHKMFRAKIKCCNVREESRRV